MYRLLLFIAFLYLLLPATAQVFNRPVPPGIQPYEFVRHQHNYNGYYLSCPFRLNSGQVAPQALFLDADGYIAWFMNTMTTDYITWFPEAGHFGLFRSSTGAVDYYLMNSSLMVTDSFTTVNGVGPDKHEIERLSNGHYVIGGARDSIMDLSSDTFNGVPGSATSVVEAYVIQEFDQQLNLVWEWNSIDHIYPTSASNFFGYNPNSYDYVHGNAIGETLDSNLLVCMRHTNAVYKIDRSNGNLLWTLGGTFSDFTFVNDSGFSGQHDARQLPNGNITVFDNANISTAQLSRAVEYVLDTINWTATRVWEYYYQPTHFSRAMGSHRTLPDGSRIINYGLNYRPAPSFIHVDASDNLISSLFYRDSVMSYRTVAFDLPLALPRPTISCIVHDSMVMLTAPNGLTDYLWSTGETTQLIHTTTPGMYQFWTSYGDGMVGSIPIRVVSTLSGCTTGVLSAEDHAAPVVTGIYDLLGRRVEVPERGRIYILIYSDGKREKRYW